MRLVFLLSFVFLCGCSEVVKEMDEVEDAGDAGDAGDVEEADALPTGPLECARDLSAEECAAVGCTFITTRWGVDHTGQSLPQACEFDVEISQSCLPLKGEEMGNLVTYFRRDLPSGDKELVLLSNHYPPDALEGWNGCWSNSGPVPAGSDYVECRCAPW